MSNTTPDDAPTEAFNAPTVPLPEQPGADAASEPSPGDERKSRTLLIALLSVAGAILLALIVLIAILLGGQGEPEPAPVPTETVSESPTPEPTDTETPEPEPEPTEEPEASASAPPPPPPPQSPSFATFNGPNRATCPDTEGQVEVTWSWSSNNAVNAWFGIGTTNAKIGAYEEVPTTATYTFYYQCSVASQIYTVTLEDANGQLQHRTVTISRQ